MTIKLGENPEGCKGINKFIANNGEGHRGRIVALHEDKKRAIVLALNTSLNTEDGVQWGRFYLIEEADEDNYPQAVKRVSCIPDEEGWEVVT